MNLKVIINISNLTKYKIVKAVFTKTAQSILQDTKLSGIVELDLIFCGSIFMRRLNNKYRSIDSVTDVLSFPLSQIEKGRKTRKTFPSPTDIPLLLGDIAICYPAAIRQAKENNITINKEINNLFQHGLRHLVGFHHK